MIIGPRVNICEDGLYLKAKLGGGIEVNCLVDTGGIKSILHPKKFYSIPSSVRPLLTELAKNIVLADGDKIRVLEQASMSLETGLGIFNHNFVVAETNEPVILENDFLSNNCCVIDVANKLFEY